MICHKKIDVICAAVTTFVLLATLLFINGEALGLKSHTSNPPYAERLFNDSIVHSIDIQMTPDAWAGMVENALEEEYIPCTAYINGEAFKNVGIRPKGNNSKNLIHRYGASRYSLKLDFGRYARGKTYHGLDKLSLNASFQDNAYMKEFMTYDMMRLMGVPSPLCAYAWVTVNGEPWGLFVAIEEIGDAFLRRNFAGRGKLYKPDYKRREDENSDVALMYTGEDFENYDNIFRNAKSRINKADKRRLIESLRKLSSGENLERALDTGEALRYFAVQAFVVNADSYLGPTGHNYFLHEISGVLSMLPWDYNLAYGTYPLGMPEPFGDAETFVNFPIDTPYSGDVMLRRPMFHNLMLNQTYFGQYREYFDTFIRGYFEGGYFERKHAETLALIAPYVKSDPTRYCGYGDFLMAADTFKEFCLLRAKSVRGQLEGAIPSTIRGQREDRSAFVDASHIRIEDLGELRDME